MSWVQEAPQTSVGRHSMHRYICPNTIIINVTMTSEKWKPEGPRRGAKPEQKKEMATKVENDD